MNNLDAQYTALLQDILDNGHQKKDRTGTGTISVFDRQIRHSMKDGFPLLTTKRIPFRLVVNELLWFLRGDTNIKFLVDNDCHIWDGDAYKAYITKTDKWSNSGPHKLTLDELKMIGVVSGPISDYNIRQFTKGEFINKIKTDDEFAKKWGDLGKIYGFQWRNWNGNPEQITNYGGGEINTYFCDCQELIEDGNSKIRKKNKGIDQIANLIHDLKTNPDSRRLMVNAWNPSELDSMVLPPCHYGFQVYTRELSLEERDVIFARRTFISTKGSFAEQSGTLADYLDKEGIPRRAISLSWNQRSVDTFLGLPFNIASYGLLLEIIAKEVNMVSDELIGNLGDTHLYSNHIEQAKEQIGRELTWEERIGIQMEINDYRSYYTKEDLDANNIQKRTREPFPLPTLKIENEIVKWAVGDCLPTYSITDFTLENYQSHPTIKAPLSN
jgi:thymidylate synthase